MIILHKSLDALAAAKRAAIQAEKCRVRDGGVVVDGVLFDTDASARVAYLEIGLKFATDPSLAIPNWKASDGQWVTMTAPLFAQVMAAGEAMLRSVFAWQEEMESLVDRELAAGDVEALTTPIQAP